LAPTPTSFVTGRTFPQVGLVWSYPLIRRGESTTELIEPIVGGFAAPSSGNRRNIPDEDSLSYELTDTDLFRRDRLAGYDILDTGQRVDYGTKLGLYEKEGGSYRLLIGQSYRAQPNPFLPPGSGAEKKALGCGGPDGVVPQLLSGPDLPVPVRRRPSNQSQPAGRCQPRAAEFAGVRQFCLSSGATAE
jgi:hypothetical protein